MPCGDRSTPPTTEKAVMPSSYPHYHTSLVPAKKTACQKSHADQLQGEKRQHRASKNAFN